MKSPYRHLVIIPAALLGLAVFDLPYGYYDFLRWSVTIAAAYVAYYYAQKEDNKLWLYVAIGLLFNPVVPFRFAKDTWVLFDLAAAVIFLIPLGEKELHIGAVKADDAR